MTTVKGPTREQFVEQFVEQLQIFEISIARKINNDALVRAKIKEVNEKNVKNNTDMIVTGCITGVMVGTIAYMMVPMLYNAHTNEKRLRNERDPNRTKLS